MKIIVLGASGQIGSIIMAGLSMSHQVAGTSRNASEKLHQFDPFKDDWSLLGPADVIINCIGLITPSRTNGFYNIHVELIKLIIANREKLGRPRIVQISALGATPQHDVEFLRTKGIGDNLLLQCEDTVVLRPSIICTPQTMIIKKVLWLSKIGSYLGGIVFVPRGFLKTRIQPVMPNDLTDTVVAVLKPTTDRVINVVGPEALSFRNILQSLFEVKKQRQRIVEVPRMLSDIVVLGLIAQVMPHLLNEAQYRLLFADNTADPNPVQHLLQRSLTSTTSFFKHEFAYASH